MDNDQQQPVSKAQVAFAVIWFGYLVVRSVRLIQEIRTEHIRQRTIKAAGDQVTTTMHEINESITRARDDGKLFGAWSQGAMEHLNVPVPTGEAPVHEQGHTAGFDEAQP